MKRKHSSNNPFEHSSELMTFFKDAYYSKYGKKLSFNRFKVKYYFLDVLEDHSVDEVKNLIEHYFKIGSNGSHSINDFLSCYDELSKNISEYSEDVEERRRLRQLTREKVEKYRKGQL